MNPTLCGSTVKQAQVKPTRLNKTRKGIRPYLKNTALGKWWPGYDGDKDVIIDDY